MNYIIVFILFLSTYLVSTVSVLYTESFILFLAFFTMLLVLLDKRVYNAQVSKERFKLNEILLYYFSFKVFNLSLIRDIDLRISLFLLFAVQIKKYQLNWIKRNFMKLKKKNIISINSFINKRGELFKFHKKNLNQLSKRYQINMLNYNNKE